MRALEHCKVHVARCPSLHCVQEMSGPSIAGHTAWPLAFSSQSQATVPCDVTRKGINTADLVPVVSQRRRSEPRNMLQVGQPAQSPSSCISVMHNPTYAQH
jgi:hypothetical protein